MEWNDTIRPTINLSNGILKELDDFMGSAHKENAKERNRILKEIKLQVFFANNIKDEVCKV